MGRREYVRERDAYIVKLAEKEPWLTYAEIARQAREALDDPYINEETVRNALRARRRRQ